MSSFLGCTSLTSADLTHVTKNIAQNAFMGCTALKRISLPENVDDSYVSNYFGIGCFNTTAIETITLPNNVTTISDNMFTRCGLLTDVKTTNSITTIGEKAFFCDQDSVGKTESPWSALVGTNLDFSNVTTIGTSAFNSCASLKNVIHLDSIQSFGERAFGDSTSIQVVDISKANDNITFATNALTNLGKNSVVYIASSNSPLMNENQGIYARNRSKRQTWD